MKKNLPIIAAGVLGLTNSWAMEGFEAPAYEAGQTVEGKGGWQGEVAIGAEQSSEGSQALKVEAGQRAWKEVQAGEGVRFYDLYVLPGYGAGEPVLKVAGAGIGFKKDGNFGKVVVVNGETSTTVGPVGVPLTPEGSASAWLRITLRIDPAKATWDLFLDSKPVYANAKLKPNSTIEVIGQEETVSYLDALSDGGENPLFVDNDKDGMPDAEEAAYELNPFVDDRDGDLDADGISNAQEMFAGTMPQIPGQPLLGTGVYMFVDNLNGNDANSGNRSYPSLGADGPKASIKAALEAAPSGATIVVMKGKGIYEEGSRGVKGKQLTIKTVESVSIN